MWPGEWGARRSGTRMARHQRTAQEKKARCTIWAGSQISKALRDKQLRTLPRSFLNPSHQGRSEDVEKAESAAQSTVQPRGDASSDAQSYSRERCCGGGKPCPAMSRYMYHQGGQAGRQT